MERSIYTLASFHDLFISTFINALCLFSSDECDDYGS